MAKISAMKDVSDTDFEIDSVESHHSIDPLVQLINSERMERVSQKCPVFFSMTEDGNQQAALNLPIFIRKSIVRKELFDLAIEEGFSREDANAIASEGADLVEGRHLKAA
jgi:hypothetical protein